MNTKLTQDEWRVHVDEQLGHIADDIKEIKDAILGMDNKYAGRWTEKVIIGLITVGATATTTFIILIFSGVINL
jgi:hypothetical protein